MVNTPFAKKVLKTIILQFTYLVFIRPFIQNNSGFLVSTTPIDLLIGWSTVVVNIFTGFVNAFQTKDWDF